MVTLKIVTDTWLKELNMRITTIFLAALLAVGSAFHCGTSDSMLEGDTKSYESEGWIDDHTFQVRALGVPRESESNTTKRKIQSKEAATLSAQARVIELMLGAKVQGATGSLDGESTGVALTKEFEGIIRGGSIVKTTYDEEQNCEVVYRVQAKGLKKRATAEISNTN